MVGRSHRRCIRFAAMILVIALGAAAQPDQPGGVPRMCGGLAGVTCPAGFDCIMQGPSHPDQVGVCRPTGGRTVCPQIYRPVCGTDGATYSNRCVAESRGATVSHDGGCEPQSAASPQPSSGSQVRPEGERG